MKVRFLGVLTLAIATIALLPSPPAMADGEACVEDPIPSSSSAPPVDVVAGIYSVITTGGEFSQACESSTSFRTIAQNCSPQTVLGDGVYCGPTLTSLQVTRCRWTKNHPLYSQSVEPLVYAGWDLNNNGNISYLDNEVVMGPMYADSPTEPRYYLFSHTQATARLLVYPTSSILNDPNSYTADRIAVGCVLV